MRTTRSAKLFETAKALLPGGVSSPVRAFNAVGGTPRFVSSADGAFMTDVDGNRYLDFVLSWGPLILGHAHPRVLEAVTSAAAAGTSFGAPCEHEVVLAQQIKRFMPHLDMLRFVNSGTEATMSAIRLARAATGRNLIVKFEGCYHGHVDALLARAGSGVATLGLPDSPGISDAVAGETLVLPFNDIETVERVFDRYAGEIAAVIVEPVAGNMGVVLPVPRWLAGLRELTELEGAVLLFDEVMTGFRVHPGGARGLYGVTPDLTTLGKVIGGGLPVGAYGGTRELMELVAPAGPVYQAGTLSGNPLAMAAGIATLDELARPGAWETIEATTRMMVAALVSAASRSGVPMHYSQAGTMFSVFFGEREVRDWSDVRSMDAARYARFFHAMLDRGVYFAPSPFEAAFVSAMHGEDEVTLLSEVAGPVFEQLV